MGLYLSDRVYATTQIHVLDMPRDVSGGAHKVGMNFEAGQVIDLAGTTGNVMLGYRLYGKVDISASGLKALDGTPYKFGWILLYDGLNSQKPIWYVSNTAPSGLPTDPGAPGDPTFVPEPAVKELVVTVKLSPELMDLITPVLKGYIDRMPKAF
jgi:hypothetical protein